MGRKVRSWIVLLKKKHIENVRPVTTAAVLDSAVLIQMLHPRNAVTLGDYFMKELVPYILSWFEGTLELTLCGMSTPVQA